MKTCIVCNEPSRNDRSSFCEDCFKEVLNEKPDKDVWKIKEDRPGDGWF